LPETIDSLRQARRWLAFGYSLALAWGRWAIWILVLPSVVGPLVVLAMLWVMRFVRQRWLWRESGMVTATRWLVPRRVNLISMAIPLVSLGLAFGLRQLGWLTEALVLRVLWAATGWALATPCWPWGACWTCGATSGWVWPAAYSPPGRCCCR
jgi:hypothetical protein